MQQFFIRLWIWITFRYGSVVTACLVDSLIDLSEIDRKEIKLSIGKNCDGERCIIIRVHHVDEFVIKILVSETTIKLYPVRLDTTDIQNHKNIDIDTEAISLSTDVTSMYLPMIDICIEAIRYLRTFIQTRVV